MKRGFGGRIEPGLDEVMGRDAKGISRASPRSPYSLLIRPYSVARSVKTIDPDMREILIFTLWPGFAFATYMM